jgi:hypothetical protein
MTRRVPVLLAALIVLLAVAVAAVAILLGHAAPTRHNTPPAPAASVQLHTLQPAQPTGDFDVAAAEHLMSSMGYDQIPPQAQAYHDPAKLPGPLRAIAGICTGSVNGRCVDVFFFYGNRFVGVSDKPGDVWYLEVENDDGTTVVLTYATALPGDPGCCPTGPTLRRTFTWNGTQVVASGATPGPVPMAPG